MSSRCFCKPMNGPGNLAPRHPGVNAWAREKVSSYFPRPRIFVSQYGDRAGEHSIRINDQFRICFRWVGGYADDVEIVDYH